MKNKREEKLSFFYSCLCALKMPNLYFEFTSFSIFLTQQQKRIETTEKMWKRKHFFFFGCNLATAHLFSEPGEKKILQGRKMKMKLVVGGVALAILLSLVCLCRRKSWSLWNLITIIYLKNTRSLDGRKWRKFT